MTTNDALLEQLSKLFKQDPLIDEIGLLFDIKQSDVTPENAFFLGNHKLGVSFAADFLLFQAARTRFHPLNVLLQQENVEMTQDEENGLREQLLHCTRAILLINADFYTAWNTRKSFVTRGWLNAQDEVLFTNLVFTLHPKSIDTWAYRRWLANRLCESLSEDNRRVFYNQQIFISNLLAEQKSRNYPAWSYRHWIVSRLSLDLTLVELDNMERWCRMHVSDHSGWNHRQHVLNELAKKYQDDGDNEEVLQKLLLTEYKFVSEVMAPYQTHEALWCHRRYVMQCLLKQISQKAMSDLSFVFTMIPQVVETLCDTKQESFGAAAISSSWGEMIKMSSNGSLDMSLVVRLILMEIEIGWKCGSLFSRRYAAWCLARLRVFFRRRKTFEVSGRDDAIRHELSSLALCLHEQLIQKSEGLANGVILRYQPEAQQH